MKKILCLLSVLWGAFSIFATVPIGPFEIGTGGEIKVGGLRFALTHADQSWGWTTQKDGPVKSDEILPAAEKEFRLNGTFRVRGGEFQFQENIKKNEKNSISIALSLNSDKGVPTGELAFCTTLPHRDFVLQGVEVNGKKVGFASEFNEKKWYFQVGGRDTTIVLPLRNGRLTIHGDFYVYLQDNRKFNASNWSLRLRTKPAAVVRNQNYRMSMTLEPYQFQTVSLKDSANLDFKDEIAGDGKGGWTDQGADNDMRSFPVSQHNYAGVEFAVTDPATNDGRAVIGLYCGQHAPAYPKSVRVAANGMHGKFLYLLHALGWEPPAGVLIGTLTVGYADGTHSVIKLKSGCDAANFWRPRQRENAIIGWRGENNSSLIGISVSRFPVEDKPVQELTFSSSGNGIWLIAGISFANALVPMTASDPVIMRANHDWKPLENDKMIRSGSILDFSDLLDAPAGKYGFIRSVNGQFEFEKRPGKPARFFGGNIAFGVNFMKNESCDKLGDLMAGMGYNFLRLHHFDNVLSKIEGKKSTDLAPKPMDRMDYMVYAMKKRGIYITLDLYIIRKLAKGEVEELPDIAPGSDVFKALPFVSESAMRSWERFSANLLNHVNPYTGLAWKDDPAIVTISLINEDTIFSEVNKHPQVRELYEKKFNEYVKTNRIAITDTNRNRQWKIFLSETYLRGYQRMTAFLRDLGVRALLTDQNMWSTIPMSLMRNSYDFVDNHFYWQHPVFLGKGWRLPMLIGNRSAIDACGGELAAMFPSRLFGKPFTVSEWDFCNPSEYVCEGALLVGAYASLQNWNGLCHFTLSHSALRVVEKNSKLVLFDLVNDPLRTLAERSAALFFLRGDVKPATEAYPFLITPDYLKEDGLPDLHPGVLARLGLIGQVGTMVIPKGKVPILPTGTRAVIGLEKYWKNVQFNKKFFFATDTDRTLNELVRHGAVPAGQINLEKGIYNSGTGELSLNRRENTFKAATSRSEGFILPEGKKLSGNYATVENKLSYGVFLVAARDARPLAESRRVLILHLTDSKNSMSRYETSDFTHLQDWGRLPVLLKRGEATITLKAPIGLKLYACRMNGERIGEIPFKRTGKSIRFDAKNLAGKEPVLVYELAD